MTIFIRAAIGTTKVVPCYKAHVALSRSSRMSRSKRKTGRWSRPAGAKAPVQVVACDAGLKAGSSTRCATDADLKVRSSTIADLTRTLRLRSGQAEGSLYPRGLKPLVLIVPRNAGLKAGSSAVTES
jgi:hypothetical protein